MRKLHRENPVFITGNGFAVMLRMRSASLRKIDLTYLTSDFYWCFYTRKTPRKGAHSWDQGIIFLEAVFNMIFANCNPQSCIKMCKSFIVKQENFFLQKFKNGRMSFLGLCIVETLSLLQASRASPAQKDLWVVSSKNFSRATFFVFWVTLLENSYLNNLPVKQIWRKMRCESLNSLSSN